MKTKQHDDEASLVMDTFYAALAKHKVSPESELAALIAMARAAVLAVYGVEEFKRFSETLKEFALNSPFQPHTVTPTEKDRQFLKSLKIKMDELE